MSLRAPAITLLLAAAGCAGTGQPEVSYQAFAVGSDPAPFPAGAWTVTLDEATVAFGPVYFCASATGSATLCEVALAELTEVTAVDAVDPAPQPLGLIRGFAGDIRSASFDYGIHWFLTDTNPVAAPEAPGGRSARFRGRAERDGAPPLSFTADVEILPQYQGQRAVPSAPAAATVGDEGARLEVRFDPRAWVERVDFDDLAAAGVTEVTIAPGDRAHDALVIAMVAQRPPAFAWSAPR